MLLRLKRRRRLRIPRKRVGRCLCATLALAATWLLAGEARAVPPQATETGVKSAFLYKFTHFAEWPAEALGSDGAPIAMCVLGRDPLAEVLEKAVRGRKARERPLVVRRVEGASGVTGCHVLFIGWSQSAKLDRILGRLARQPTLTVGDAAGFAHRGGMINLTKQGNRVRLEINRRAAERAGIQLSSQLLKLADLVGEDGGEE